MILQLQNIEKQSDSELLQLFCKSKNNEYLGYLYNRYTPLIYGVCLRYLQNADDAQDAVMQIFEDLLNKVEKYEIKEFRTWIYSVSRNYCLQKMRKKKVEVAVDFTKDYVEYVEITQLLNNHDDEKKFDALKTCLEKLPEPQRECITQFFFAEKSYADIVDEGKYHLKSVKSYIQNGKRNLKICVEQNLKCKL